MGRVEFRGRKRLVIGVNGKWERYRITASGLEMFAGYETNPERVARLNHAVLVRFGGRHV